MPTANALKIQTNGDMIFKPHTLIWDKNFHDPSTKIQYVYWTHNKPMKYWKMYAFS